jgi:hypothetical protein
MSFVAASLRILAGPILWILHFAAIYGSTAVACARAAPRLVPWAVGIATLAAGAACMWIVLRESGPRGFEPWITVGLAGIALVAIVWEAVPVLVVAPCAR